MVSAYCTQLDVAKYPSGLDTDDLIGNVLYLSGNISAGATSLTLQAPGLTIQLNVNDALWIFDGPNTEKLSVTAQAVVGATSISVSALQFAHSNGVLLISDGTDGSLAQECVDAADTLENVICFQSRWQATYTETLPVPSLQAAVSQDLQLLIRPQRFPVASIASVQISRYGIATSYDISQAIIENGGKTVKVPALVPVGDGNSQVLNVPIVPTAHSSNITGDLTLTYTAGYGQGSLPGRIRLASIFLVCDLLAAQQNPGGVQEQSLGKRHFKVGTNMDSSGDTRWKKQAIDYLKTDVLRAW